MIRIELRRARGCLGLALALVLLLLLLFWTQTGPEDLSRYPDRAEPPYLLPWSGGDAHLCVQGNRGFVSHRDRGEFSYDFAMPTGTVVSAARAGRVIQVVDVHTGNGTDKPNNKVGVDHGDGTRGWYLHLQQGGALVQVGDVVAQGDPLARSGNVGRSMLPHLHIHVTGPGGATIPFVFRDVERQGGIPRTLNRYSSGNRRLP